MPARGLRRRRPRLRGTAGASAALVIVLAAAAGGCASQAADGDATAIEVEEARLSDSLLNRPELQRVVELQIARDGGALAERLGDPNPLVRARALLALASVRDTAAVPAILPLLDDPEWTVRRDAAIALGQAGLPRTAPLMLEALARETEPEVRRRLMEAAGKAGDAAALASLHALAPPDRERAHHRLALARFGIRGIHDPDVVRTLAADLTDHDATVREHAAYYFGRVTSAEPWSGFEERLREALDALDPADPAAMHLLAALARLADPADRERFAARAQGSGDWRIRVNAVRALGSQPDGARVRDALVGALGDASTHVGVTAATALASRELPPRDLERLRRWIDDNPERWRVAAPLLVALARQGHGDFVAAWTAARAGGSPAPMVRGLAALATVPGEAAFRVLLTAATSPNDRVAAAAVVALATRWPSDRRNAALREPYAAVFADALGRGDPAAAGAAARALLGEAFRPHGGFALVEARWKEMNPRADAASMGAILDALAASHDPRAVPLLRAASGHADPEVRRRAARGLAAMAADGVEGAGEAVESAEGGAAGASGRAGADDAAAGASGEAEEGARPRVRWDDLRALGRHPRLVLETNRGRIVVVLATEEAPLTVQTIARYAREGRFDGVPFHRVVPNFVIQGGDLRRGPRRDAPDGPIRSEPGGILFGRGVLGMASAGADTETSQFFITHSMQPHLDGGYTAFGWVVEGMDVVDAVGEDDVVERATVEPGRS